MANASNPIGDPAFDSMSELQRVVLQAISEGKKLVVLDDVAAAEDRSDREEKP